MRLIAETEAGYAYAALSRRVKSNFNRERGSADETQIKEMMRQAHLELSAGIDEIEQKLADVDIKALKSLALDEDRKNRNGK